MELRIDAPKHPATFRDDHIDTFRRILAPLQVTTILDPFAGVGTVHLLRGDGYETWGIEREPEWALQGGPFNLTGDALLAPQVLANAGAPATFDAIVTSPSYGNRMADSHEAKDTSRRHTYRHYLGRPIAEGSSAIMNWGRKYRAFHEEAWDVTTDLATRYFVLNMKDHVRNGKVVEASKWHVGVLGRLGWEIVDTIIMESPGQRHGQNRDARIDHEYVFLFEKP